MSYPHNPQSGAEMCTFLGKNLNFHGPSTNKRPPNYAQIKLNGGVVHKEIHRRVKNGEPSST